MGQNDGRHDFDFLFGAWQITNRKRVNMVVPGDDFYVLCEEIRWHRRSFKSRVQGVVDGRLTFEAQLSGLAFD